MNQISLQGKKRIAFAVSLPLFLLLTGIVSAQTWTGPTATPPGNNTPPPVNTGAVLQVKSGTLGVGELLSGGEVVTSSRDYGAFRMVGITKLISSFFRNDGARTYLLLTDEGTAQDPKHMGQWNGLRPFYIQNETGDVSLGGEALFVKHGGNVGIGAGTNPQAKLHVGGDILINNNREDGSGVKFASLKADGTSAALYEMDTLRGSLRFFQPGAVRMTLDPNGQVGIGTGAPAAQLHTTGSVRFAGLTSQPTYDEVVVRDTNGQLGVRPAADFGGSDSTGGSKWSDTSVRQPGIYYQSNVGVGTNDLIRPLTVNGQIASSGFGNTTINAGGVFLYDRDSNKGWFVGNRGRAPHPSSLNNSSNSNNFKIGRCESMDCEETPNNTILEITRAGSVGIGTISPSGRLSVAGDIYAAGVNASQLFVSGSNMSGIRYHRNARDARITVSTPEQIWSIANGWGSTGDTYSLNAFSIIDESNGVVPFTVTTKASNSNVGIGTTGPSQRLDVAGGGVRFRNLPTDSASTEIVTISGTGVLGRRAVTDLTGTESGDSAWTTSGSNIYNANTGNVGIGVTSPQAKLHTGGSVRLSNLPSQPSYPRILLSDMNGNLGYGTVAEVVGSGSGSGLPAGTTGQTLRHNGTSWVSTSNLQNSGSKITVAASPNINENELVVNGITQTTGLLAGAVRTQAFILDGNGAGTGKVLTSNTSGAASWQEPTVSFLPNLQQRTNTNQVVVRDASTGELGWQYFSQMYSLFEKNSGANSLFTLVGGMTGPSYRVEENSFARDYLMMICPSGWAAVSGGAECGFAADLKASRMGDDLREWRVSCGDELNNIVKASISCKRLN